MRVRRVVLVSAFSIFNCATITPVEKIELKRLLDEKANNETEKNARAAEEKKLADIGNQKTAGKTSAAVLDEMKSKLIESNDSKLDASDSEKSKKLLQLGVTLGTAATIQVPIPASRHRLASITKNTSFTAMPYVAFLPAFWFQAAEVRKYCASTWTGDQTAAEDAAIAASRQWARRVVLASIDSFTNGATVDEITGWWIELIGIDEPTALAGDDRDRYNAKKNWLTALADALRKAIDDGSQPNIDAVIRDLAAWRWDVGLSSTCIGNKFGAWAGFPVAFEVQTDRTNPAQTQFKPIVAAGLTFTPNAYVSLLLGATWGQLITDQKRQNDIVFNVGIGGNLDIFTSIIGK